MTKETALRILGLKEPVDKKVIAEAYRKLAQAHHPDKYPDDTFIYELNEAKNVLLGESANRGNMALSVIVTNALMKYREAEQKEVEYKNEASLLLSEKVKPRRNKITQLRDLSAVATFFMAVVGFSMTSMSGFLDFTYENDNDAVRYSKDFLEKDSTIKTKNHDSLYFNDTNYKKKVDNYYTNTIKKEEKKRNGIYKLIGVFMIGFGGVLIARIQMKLKRYDTNLDEFKSHIDSRVKLKSLLLDIITKNQIGENKVSEDDLKTLIHHYFAVGHLNDSQFKSIIDLAMRLQLDDIEKIIVLKFLEKKLIEEREFKEQNIVYNILI